jgi:starch synthase
MKAEWNPATDPALAQNYDVKNLAGKITNKLELQKRMGLKVDPDVPLFGLVSRFTFQKGLDVVLEIAPQLISFPAQLVLLGSGDVPCKIMRWHLLANIPARWQRLLVLMRRCRI